MSSSNASRLAAVSSVCNCTTLLSVASCCFNTVHDGKWVAGFLFHSKKEKEKEKKERKKEEKEEEEAEEEEEEEERQVGMNGVLPVIVDRASVKFARIRDTAAIC